VTELVELGCSLDLPLDWGAHDTKLVAAVAADLLHERWRESFHSQEGSEKGRWKAIDSDGLDKDW